MASSDDFVCSSMPGDAIVPVVSSEDTDRVRSGCTVCLSSLILSGRCFAGVPGAVAFAATDCATVLFVSSSSDPSVVDSPFTVSVLS